MEHTSLALAPYLGEAANVVWVGVGDDNAPMSLVVCPSASRVPSAMFVAPAHPTSTKVSPSSPCGRKALSRLLPLAGIGTMPVASSCTSTAVCVARQNLPSSVTLRQACPQMSCLSEIVWCDLVAALSTSRRYADQRMGASVK